MYDSNRRVCILWYPPCKWIYQLWEFWSLPLFSDTWRSDLANRRRYYTSEPVCQQWGSFKYSGHTIPGGLWQVACVRFSSRVRPNLYCIRSCGICCGSCSWSCSRVHHCRQSDSEPQLVFLESIQYWFRRGKSWAKYRIVLLHSSCWCSFWISFGIILMLYRGRKFLMIGWSPMVQKFLWTTRTSSRLLWDKLFLVLSWRYRGTPMVHTIHPTCCYLWRVCGPKDYSIEGPITHSFWFHRDIKWWCTYGIVCIQGINSPRS